MTTTATTATSVPASVASLDNYSALAPQVHFNGVATLFKTLAALPADCDGLEVGNVSTKAFQDIDAERDRRHRRLRLMFLPNTGCAIITIPTLHHERAHMGLYAQNHFGAATLPTSGGNAGSGEGDSGGGPLIRGDGSQVPWPTFVIESGVTQSLSSLRVKARWWFEASAYRVKVIVLVKVIRTTHVVHIEKWTTAAGPDPRRGATVTRASHGAHLVPTMEQLVVVRWAGSLPLPQVPRLDRSHSDFQVEGAPLVLHFEELMDREPVAGTPEQDVLISEWYLQIVAQEIWTSDRGTA
ncbi:hypothetical protein SCUCBS95973_000891 [Sporothrix curviconia]|uniref:HNH nuclease domain-containing protein n=1 Tax=Sporothrix curviconia TaxID=1260050 RepID=A0ABP0AUB1_9PEZI